MVRKVYERLGCDSRKCVDSNFPSSTMYAKKSLGQHFLQSKKALSQIINAGDIHADDMVLEIGPGKGVLTEQLVTLSDKVIAVEKDRELVTYLSEHFSDAIAKNRLDLIQADILKWDPEILRFYNKPYKLIANIPYYITGAIIEKFLSTSQQPERMVLLMQREVAERIVACDDKQSILSVAVQVYGTPRIVGRVPPGAFVPPPTVESAVLLIENIGRDFFSDCDEALFFSILKAVFGKKRKQIGGTLTEYLGHNKQALLVLEQSNIPATSRPEDLTRFQWKALTQATAAVTKNSVQ